MNTSAQDAEREVEASRARFDETVDALKEKLTPGQMFDEMSRSFAGSSGGEMFANFGSQVRDNPLPLALIGAGVALLAMKSTTAVNPSSGGSSTIRQGMGEGLADSLSAGKEKLQDLAGSVAHAAGAVSEKLGGVSGHAGDSANSASDAMSRYGQRTVGGFQGLLEREPLVIAALGLAIGAAIGAALPASEIEDRLLGPARDNVVHRGQDLASEGVAAVKTAADDVASGVAETLRSDQGDQRPFGEKVGQAAQTAAETVAQHVQDAKPH
jgi:hypothetical protein